MHTFYMPKRIRPDIFFIVKKKHKLGVDHSPKKVTLWGTFKPSKEKMSVLLYYVRLSKQVDSNQVHRKHHLNANA